MFIPVKLDMMSCTIINFTPNRRSMFKLFHNMKNDMKPRSIDKKYNAIEKCLQILSMFSLDKSTFTIKEICDRLNFNVSTAYRIPLCFSNLSQEKQYD